ncbi:MAG: DUF84 family protein [Candidatus Pacebacteria bacterium]|nr:DUF84 family protein [Candidatus Paceibacterota bacterium]
MKIILGSTSSSKEKIVQSFFSKEENLTIQLYNASSGIPEQPLDEATTIRGSINRATDAATRNANEFDFAIGMEGGLVKVGNLYYLVCVASIFTPDKRLFTGVSKKVSLPRAVSEGVDRGEEFGVAIREFEKNDSVEDVKELVQELISREKGFIEALDSAFFQYKNKKEFI